MLQGEIINMVFEAAIVFFLGIIFLVWGLKTSNKPDNDILAALKGLALVRQEVKSFRQQVNSLEQQVRVIDQKQKSNQQEEINNQQESKNLNQELQRLTQQVNNLKLGQTEDTKNELRTTNSEDRIAYSERYREIINLAQKGYSVIEIADNLAIGQDAVNMVINTYWRYGNE